MDITVKAFPSGISIIATIVSLLMLAVGIYLIFLLIKALRLYTKKNS